MERIALTSNISGSAIDLAKELGPSVINEIFETVYHAYILLNNDKIITTKSSEWQITDKLFVKVQIIWKENTTIPLIPHHEKSIFKGNRGRPKSIDFCFRNDFNLESYLGFECKLLDEHPRPRKKNKRNLYSYYINGGVKRYLNGDYSPESAFGSMIGYIRIKDIDEVVTKIKTKINKLNPIVDMSKSNVIWNYNFQFESFHRRSNGTRYITIYHLFFVFNQN